MSEHTPGPWKIAPSEHLNRVPTLEIQHGDVGELVCIMESADQEADARLIAAAPDLLEALRAMLTMMDRGPQPKKFDEALTWRQNDEHARALACAAIAKAEGAPNGDPPARCVHDVGLDDRCWQCVDDPRAGNIGRRVK